MSKSSPPKDLSERWRKLAYELERISQTTPAVGDPELARMAAATIAVIDFLEPIQANAGSKQLLRPLYDILEEHIQRRTAEADSQNKKTKGGRPGVGVWETAKRAVALAAVDLLKKHNYSPGDARKVIAAQLRAKNVKPIPSHTTLSKWEHEWEPRQAQPRQLTDGHMPPAVVRQAALQRMEGRVSAGDDPITVIQELLTNWFDEK